MYSKPSAVVSWRNYSDVVEMNRITTNSLQGAMSVTSRHSKDQFPNFNDIGVYLSLGLAHS